MFDHIMETGLLRRTKARGMLRFRQRPYGLSSYFDFFRAIREYQLSEVAGRIRCPMLITAPEGEQFFPGHSQRLFDALRCPKKLISFSASKARISTARRALRATATTAFTTGSEKSWLDFPLQTAPGFSYRRASA